MLHDGNHALTPRKSRVASRRRASTQSRSVSGTSRSSATLWNPPSCCLQSILTADTGAVELKAFVRTCDLGAPPPHSRCGSPFRCDLAFRLVPGVRRQPAGIPERASTIVIDYRHIRPIPFMAICPRIIGLKGEPTECMGRDKALGCLASQPPCRLREKPAEVLIVGVPRSRPDGNSCSGIRLLYCCGGRLLG